MAINRFMETKIGVKIIQPVFLVINKELDLFRLILIIVLKLKFLTFLRIFHFISLYFSVKSDRIFDFFSS